MQGNLYTGWYELAGQFPASLNTSDDPTKIKVYESPACYGTDCTKDGRLAVGSVVTGTTRSAPTKAIGSTTYNWIYNRLWLPSSTTLRWGAPDYDANYFPHGIGALMTDYVILAIMPCLDNQLWVLTADGSYFISGANSRNEDFELGEFHQELRTSSATYAMTLNGMPVVSNSAGVYMYDGNKITELTRPVRSSVGSFTATAITADYLNKRIIGGTKWVIDAQTGKLFDYGTTGFLFTTRALTQVKGYAPFTVNSMAISFELGSVADGTISWATKAEDGDWFQEEDIEIKMDEPDKTRIERMILNQNRSVHKFQVKITALSSHIYIRSILLNLVDLAIEGSAE